ncbi:MAG: hypothetical protein ACXWXO_11585 [Nocardioides sp.]
MSGISRRSALLATIGGMASAASVSAWLVRGWADETAPAQGRRIRTSFGSVLLVASRWEAGPGLAGATSSGESEAVWLDRVIVLVEVRNQSQRPVRIAPGQFLLRVGQQGPTMTFVGAEPYGGIIAAGRMLHLRLTFLTPSQFSPLGLEYWEDGGQVSQVAALAATGSHSLRT